MLLRVIAFVSSWFKKQKRPTTVKTIREKKAFASVWGLDWTRVLVGAKWTVGAVTAWLVVSGALSLGGLLIRVSLDTWVLDMRNTFFTGLRVLGAVVVGSLWAIPLGVWIGTHPQWTRRLQPIVQITASFPYPMVFPIITAWLLKIGVGIEIGSVFLMVFGSQWYILFNVISGATRIPKHLLEVASVFRIRGMKYWGAIILPSIFPALLNGWITAAGGAWNACIVSEFVQQGSTIVLATGIGSSITTAALQTDFPGLAAAVVVMVTTVVLVNRLLWGGLYHLAETKYRLDAVNE